MIKKIKKRDGRIVVFNPEKITEAIFKAAQAVGGKDRELAAELTERIVKKIEERFGERLPDVETVQDIVEKTLVEDGHYKTAKAYILYREQHKQLREVNFILTSEEVIQDYLDQLDWRVKENSNMGYSLQGLNNHIASIVTSKFWLNSIYPPEIRRAHTKGDFHVHDLGILSAYCCGWDLKDILLRGFSGVGNKVESKPPKHFRTALGQLVNFFYTLQGESAGAQAISNFDSLLAPFIKYDNLTYDEVKQCMQEFLFNMNVPTRVGFQTPFTNLTFDLNVPEYLKDEHVIVGGIPRPETYKEFQNEINMINKSFAELMMAGDAKGRVFTFPIPTYNITKDFDWDNPLLEPVWEMTAKYGIPYFSNFVNSDMKPEDARSMCPLDGNEKVLIKSSRGRNLEYSGIRNIYEGGSKQEEYEIYSDGIFVKGKFNKFKNQNMLKIILKNGHEIKMSDEHLNYVLIDDNEEIVKGKELEKEMYLPYSLKQHKGSGGNEELGYFVGAYAGDGSFDSDTGVVFSLEGNFKKQIIEKLIKISEKYFGAHYKLKKYKKTKLVTLKIYSKAAVGLCKDFVEGKQREKHYKARLFDTSLDFRKGVLKGHYDTDGGNRNRIYTSSEKMVKSLNMLAATLGTTTSIYVDKRKGRFSKEPNYVVLIYKLNRKNYGSVWKKKNKKLWVKIKEIKKLGRNSAYCFEVKNNQPMFTVGTTGILTHNCRLRLDNQELRKRGGGLFGANPLTGSIGVVTINLVRLGYLSETETEYFQRLEKLMNLAKESLEIKRKVIEAYTERGLYPYSKSFLSVVKKRFGQYWKNHFSTIGLIGMNESMLNFMGQDITQKDARNFALKVLEFMRNKMIQYQNETNHLYNLEATPGEGTTFTLAKKDKKLYPDILAANEDDIKKGAGPYYTNSTQLPVDFGDDIFEALDLQDDLQQKYTGGTVFHTFIGEKLPNIESVKKLVKKIAYNYHLPYYTLCPTFSICPNCGYLAGEHEYCPKCELIPEAEAQKLNYGGQKDG